MTISIITNRDNDPTPWVQSLKKLAPSLDIRIRPDDKKRADVTFALCWKQPAGVLKEYPNLECICSMGAGVDHLFNDPFFPDHLPVIRIIDPLLTRSMFEYICATALYLIRNIDRYTAQQRQSQWQVHRYATMKETTIGIMGLGQLGAYAAENLFRLGFTVRGWSNTLKHIKGVTTYDAERLEPFLSGTDILVCLLPLTDQTRGLLNRALFDHLPEGAGLINVGRGGHLVEADLLAALDTGQLSRACLDVFATEPLPVDHPFWRHDRILVTPHCSSITDPDSVAPQIVKNYRLMENGAPLINQVDTARGY